LASQIERVAFSLGFYLNVVSYAAIGGTALRQDVEKIKKGVHLLVGTPGRVNDLVDREVLRIKSVHTFILDEADEMLSRGFQEQIASVFRRLPLKAQICLFSATLPVDVLEVTKNMMRDPVSILVKQEEVTLEGIKQYYVNVEGENEKLSTLLDLYEHLTITQAIIYCNSRRKVDWLSDKLNGNDFTVSAMHAELTPAERELVMKEFRSGSSRVLIATDLLCRGIDVHQVSLVINYDLPPQKENYVHRIGRSGRFGRKGVALNLVTNEDESYLEQIQAFYNTQIVELPADVSNL